MIAKCEHGVYNPEAPAPARYCSSCTPRDHDRTLIGLHRFKHKDKDTKAEPTLHVDEFLLLPVGARLATLAREET